MRPNCAGGAAAFLSPDTLPASGRSSSEGLSLSLLQSKMKVDPDGYIDKLHNITRRFESSLDLFRRHSTVNPSSDTAVAKELGDITMFLAHVSPFYPRELEEFPYQIANLLKEDGRSLPSSLRCHLAQALVLLSNRKVIGIDETLELFMELQVLGDRKLKKLAFSHVIHSIRRMMKQKHTNEAENTKLQNIIFLMLQGKDEARAKSSLVVLCELHRRKVWFDERTANAICTACFHSSARISISAISFLMGFGRVEEEDDNDESSGEEDVNSQKSQIILTREAVYKAHHKGTNATKKKKKAKLQRVMRSIKRKQRASSENSSPNSYSPLTHLKDAQGFAKKLYSHLRECNERFEVKMMIMKLIARTIGLHRLVLLEFYPHLQIYVMPHQRDVTELLAAVVQACHDMVPPDAVEPILKQIVDKFVHDRSRTEAIAVGLNVVREICLRMPLLMNEDLLHDLVLYKKSHEKAVSMAARSLITLFREICPSMLVKKDRGRPINPKAKPKAFGEISVASEVPGLELLQEDDSNASGSDDDVDACEEENEGYEEACAEESEVDEEASAEESERDEEFVKTNDDDVISEEENEEGEGHDMEEDESKVSHGVDNDHATDDDDADLDDDNDSYDSDNDSKDSDNDLHIVKEAKSKAQKRKFADYVGQFNASDSSLRALKKLAETKMPLPSETADGILSNEDFQRIKELKAKKEAKLALAQQGLLKKGAKSKATGIKIPTSDQLSMKYVDPAMLEVHIKRKLSKEERLAIVRAGRADRGKYMARAAVKQKKTGGLSNRQKEHKKAMPRAAIRAKAARSRQEKKKQSRRAGKQFGGKKAWK